MWYNSLIISLINYWFTKGGIYIKTLNNKDVVLKKIIEIRLNDLFASITSDEVDSIYNNVLKTISSIKKESRDLKYLNNKELNIRIDYLLSKVLIHKLSKYISTYSEVYEYKKYLNYIDSINLLKLYFFNITLNKVNSFEMKYSLITDYNSFIGDFMDNINLTLLNMLKISKDIYNEKKENKYMIKYINENMK